VKIVNFVHIDTTWYEFHFFVTVFVLPWYINFKNSQILVPNGYVKIPIIVQHCKYPCGAKKIRNVFEMKNINSFLCKIKV
jgi:hypothetical protein